MTEQTPENVSEATGAAETTQAPGTATDTGNATQETSREAARYRVRLRETETERDALAERVRTYEAADVERSVAGRLADPADLWSHTSLDELRGDDGGVDAAKVTAAAVALLEAKPHYGNRPRTPKPDLSQGSRGAAPEEPRIGGIFSKR